MRKVEFVRGGSYVTGRFLEFFSYQLGTFQTPRVCSSRKCLHCSPYLVYLRVGVRVRQQRMTSHARVKISHPVGSDTATSATSLFIVILYSFKAALCKTGRRDTDAGHAVTCPSPIGHESSRETNSQLTKLELAARTPFRGDSMGSYVFPWEPDRVVLWCSGWEFGSCCSSLFTRGKIYFYPLEVNKGTVVLDASGSQWTPTYTLLNRCGIRAYLIFRPFSHCQYVELYMYSCCPILTRFYRCGSSRTCPINIGVFLFLFVFFPASFSFVVLSFSPSVRPSRWQARLCYRKHLPQIPSITAPARRIPRC